MLKKLCLIISVFLLSCVGQAPPFDWAPKLYYGDSGTQSIAGAEEIIKTSDPRFNEMVCMAKNQPSEVLKKVRVIYDSCEVWKKNSLAPELMEAFETWSQ
jgi:hypothetical protein